MNAKAKLITAIAVLVIGLGGIVGAIWGVIAANMVNVTAPIHVGYTSEHVAATLKASYTDANGQEVYFKTSNNEEQIVFDGSESTENNANQKGFVSPDNSALELNDDRQSITFTFYITNNSEYAITGEISLPETEENVTVTKTAKANSENENFVENINCKLTIAAGKTGVYKVTVTVASLAKNAVYDGVFNWHLAKTRD